MQEYGDETSTSLSNAELIRRLKDLARTRWTCRGSAGDVVVKKHPELIQLLANLSTDESNTFECRCKSKSLVSKLKTLDVFDVIAMRKLAYTLEMSSKQLQSATATAENALYAIKVVTERLKVLRSDAEFERLFTDARKLIKSEESQETLALLQTQPQRIWKQPWLGFSVMRRIKPWLRSRMNDNALNHKMFANIHKKN